MAQMHRSSGHANYEYITPTNYYKPATDTCHNGTYGNNHGHGNGHAQHVGQAQYGHVTHGGIAPQHGYNNTNYGYQKDHGIMKTHTESSYTHATTGHAHGHHKARPAGYQRSTKKRSSIVGGLKIRKKRDDGCSDYSSDSSCSDSD